MALPPAGSSATAPADGQRRPQRRPYPSPLSAARPLSAVPANPGADAWSNLAGEASPAQPSPERSIAGAFSVPLDSVPGAATRSSTASAHPPACGGAVTVGADHVAAGWEPRSGKTIFQQQL